MIKYIQVFYREPHFYNLRPSGEWTRGKRKETGVIYGLNDEDSKDDMDKLFALMSGADFLVPIDGRTLDKFFDGCGLCREKGQWLYKQLRKLEDNK